jgi:hypothetical protein
VSACAAACSRRPARANCVASHGSSPGGPLSREAAARHARCGRCVRRGDAGRDPALRVTSGMSAIRTHVRAQCEEQARLEHMFVWLRPGSLWGLGCADIWLIGYRAGGPGAVPRVAADVGAVPSTESRTLAALARLGHRCLFLACENAPA